MLEMLVQEAFQSLLCGCQPEKGFSGSTVVVVKQPKSNDRAARFTRKSTVKRTIHSPRALAPNAQTVNESAIDAHTKGREVLRENYLQNKAELFADDETQQPAPDSPSSLHRWNSLNLGWGSMKLKKATSRRHSEPPELGQNETKSFTKSGFFGRFKSKSDSNVLKSADSASQQSRGSLSHNFVGSFIVLPHKSETRQRQDCKFEGEKAVVLHDYVANDVSPFPPDPRLELSCPKGKVIDLLEMRSDGWCLIRKPRGTKEYWFPGNYLSIDGETAYYDNA